MGLQLEKPKNTTVYKIDFHVAAESSMFFLFPRAFAFDFDVDFDFALPPCASLPSALVWG